MTYLFKFLLANQLIILARFFMLFRWTSGIAHLLFEDAFVFFENFLNKHVLTHPRRSNQNKWLTAEWSGVEGVEVLLCININIIWLVQKHRTEEIIENFSDLWVILNVLLVGLSQLVFSDRQIGQYFVVEVG